MGVDNQLPVKGASLRVLMSFPADGACSLVPVATLPPLATAPPEPSRPFAVTSLALGTASTGVFVVGAASTFEDTTDDAGGATASGVRSSAPVGLLGKADG